MMPEQDPILSFIDARLTEEEADAQAARAVFSSRRHPSQGAWAANVDEAGPGVELLDWLPSVEIPEAEVNVMGGKWGQIGHWEESFVGWEGENLDAYEDVVRHIAHQDPRGTLGRVAALRALVEPHRPYEHRTSYHRADSLLIGVECDRCIAPKEEQEDWPCDVVKGVAAIWPKHPEYDESWRP